MAGTGDTDDAAGDSTTGEEPASTTAGPATGEDGPSSDDGSGSTTGDDEGTPPFEVIDCSFESGNLEDPRCRQGELGTLGSGPPFHDGSSSSTPMSGGFIDGDELVVAVGGKLFEGDFVGGIFAIDLWTGDRRVISGQYYDLDARSVLTKGEGPVKFGDVSDVVQGSDGSLYAFSAEASSGQVFRRILRIDPQTGNWTSYFELEGEAAGSCRFALGGTAGAAQGALAISDSDDLYISYEGLEEQGVARISAGSPTCEVISSQTVGQGTVLNGTPGAIRWFEGALYVNMAFSGELISIDPTTGNRTLVSTIESPPIGTGPDGLGIANGWMDIDDDSRTAWITGECSTACSGASYAPIMSVDLASGDRDAASDTAGEGPGIARDRTNVVYALPGTDFVLIGDSRTKSLLIYDPATGNRNHSSY